MRGFAWGPQKAAPFKQGGGVCVFVTSPKISNFLDLQVSKIPFGDPYY